MRSVTFSQRVPARTSNLNRRSVPFSRIYYKRAVALKVKSNQVATILQGSTSEDTNQKLISLFREEYNLENLLDSLKDNQDQLEGHSLAVAAGSFRKLVADYRRDMKKQRETAHLPVEAVQQGYRILTRIVSAKLDTLRFSYASDVVWCLVSVKNDLEMHTEVDDCESVLKDLFVQAGRHVEENYDIQFSSLKLSRLLSFMVDYLDENNRKHFDTMFNKVLTYSLGRIGRRQSIDLIEIFAKIQCTDLNILDKYVSHMYENHFNGRNQVFARSFCSSTARLRYYIEGSEMKILDYLQSDHKHTNGGAIASIAQYVATLSKPQHGREQLAKEIVSLTLKKVEHVWTSDIVRILHDTASAGCPEEEYNQLVRVLLQRIGDDFGELSEVDLRLIRQAQILQMSQGVSIELPQELQVMCANAQSAYINTVVQDIKKEVLSLNILPTIQQQYQNVYCGTTVLDGQLAIPILVDNDKQQVVIQPLFQQDFVLNVPGRLLESKKAEYRILESLGYQIQKVERQRWCEDDSYKDQILNELSQRLNGVLADEQNENVFR